MAIIGPTLLSGSLVCTVRRWLLKPSDLKKAVDEAASASSAQGGKLETAIAKGKKETALTEEEERELAELLEEDV